MNWGIYLPYARTSVLKFTLLHVDINLYYFNHYKIALLSNIVFLNTSVFTRFSCFIVGMPKSLIGLASTESITDESNERKVAETSSRM
jgi:hypothetical protein